MTDAPLSTKAREITLFEDRAEVVRVAEVPVVEGAVRVELDGVTPFVDDRSLEVTADGATVLSARILRRYVSRRSASAAEVEGLEEKSREAVRAVQAAELDNARAEATLTRLDSLEQVWLEAFAEPPPSFDPAEWQQTLGRILDGARDTLARADETLRRTEDARLELMTAKARLEAARAERPRLETVVQVQLEANAEGTARVELRYRTPCALWRPEHRATLVREESSAKVEIETLGTAWQLTGESWTDVRVRFSTARPAEHAEPPQLSEDRLWLRAKTEEERRTIEIEAREQQIQTAGVDGARAVDEMPGVDDGGEPALFEPEGAVTLASDGRPFRVELGTTQLGAEVALVAFPERTQAVHLRATTTLKGGRALLAGPVTLARDGVLVGRGRVGFVSPGEPFELGFGIDDGLRVRRTFEDKQDTVPVLGTQKLRRTVKLFVSNLSGAPRRVELTERVPVSDLEDVSIQLVDAKHWRFDDRDGFARHTLPLGPRETQTVVLSWELKAGSKVRLPARL